MLELGPLVVDLDRCNGKTGHDWLGLGVQDCSFGLAAHKLHRSARSSEVGVAHMVDEEGRKLGGEDRILGVEYGPGVECDLEVEYGLGVEHGLESEGWLEGEGLEYEELEDMGCCYRMRLYVLNRSSALELASRDPPDHSESMSVSRNRCCLESTGSAW